MNAKTYWPSLDGIRGLAILLVIAHNAQMIEPIPPGPAGKMAAYLLNIGWIGVLLFFVLSGFLITGILLDTLQQPHGMRNFLARRALRIFPLYYGTLAFFFVLLPAFGAQPESVQASAPHQGWLWAYLGNWTHYEWALPHLWSLAVEEQFYLVWPLVVYLFRTPRAVAVASAVVALASVAARAVMWHQQADPSFIYAWTPTRLDALALGALAAAAWRLDGASECLNRLGRWLLPAGVAVLAIGFVLTKGYARLSAIGQILGYAALAAFFTALVWRAAWQDQQAASTAPTWHRVLTWAPLTSVGRYSYAMYMFHKPLHDFFSPAALKALNIQTAGSPFWATLHVAGVSLAAYCLAWLSWHLYEVHFLRLKRLFE
ncbi:MAG: acyltransferase family protein [Acidobacteriota bacterium]